MDRQNKIIGSVLVFRDITEKRKMEAELVNAQKLESLGVLAGGIAHDFNNLLAIIRTHAETASLGPHVSGDTRAMSEMILGTVDRASGLVSQLLRYARPGRKDEFVFRLDQMISNLIKELRTSVPNGIAVSFRNPENLSPMVQVDLDQFKAMFLNLWVNACHAMGDSGSFTITIRNAPKEPDFGSRSNDEHEYVQIDVSDTGHGIDEKNIKKIFDPFFTTKGPSGGTGLGLSIIYNFIKENNGRIDVASTPGEGTTFSIFLPVSRSAVIYEHQLKPKTVDLCGLRIFILEDEPELSTAMARMISISNGVSDQVGCLQEAMKRLQSFSEFPYDVLVTDYQLYDGTGLEFHAALSEKFGEVPTVVISGNLDYADRYFKQNAPDSVQFLPKPFAFNEFMICLDKAAEMQRDPHPVTARVANAVSV